MQTSAIIRQFKHWFATAHRTNFPRTSLSLEQIGGFKFDFNFQMMRLEGESTTVDGKLCCSSGVGRPLSLNSRVFYF